MSTDVGLLILRLAAGGMMLGHGWGKLHKVLSGNWAFADPIGIGTKPSLALAVFAEFFCALLVAVGFKTRIAAIPVVITMAVAALVVHRGDPWNDKELAILYGAAFLTLALCGGGRYALDSYLGSGKGKRKKK